MKKPLPTPEELRALLRYEPETGRLYWLLRAVEMFASECAANAWNAFYAGAETFTANCNGYRSGRIHGKTYRAHRVIWTLYHGDWPPEQIDHINGIRDDNRIENLRAVSPTVNHRNKKMQSNNTSGHNGVCWHRRKKKWHAKIKSSGKFNGKFKHLGYFNDIEDAVAARKAAEEGLGFTERHGLDDTHEEI